MKFTDKRILKLIALGIFKTKKNTYDSFDGYYVMSPGNRWYILYTRVPSVLELYTLSMTWTLTFDEQDIVNSTLKYLKL